MGRKEWGGKAYSIMVLKFLNVLRPTGKYFTESYTCNAVMAKYFSYQKAKFLNFLLLKGSYNFKKMICRFSSNAYQIKLYN